MDSKILRDIYDTLLDTGELSEVMPTATGIWEEDKGLFRAIQEGLDEALDGKEVTDHLALFATDFDEYDDDDDDDVDDWDDLVH